MAPHRSDGHGPLLDGAAGLHFERDLLGPMALVLPSMVAFSIGTASPLWHRWPPQCRRPRPTCLSSEQSSNRGASLEGWTWRAEAGDGLALIRWRRSSWGRFHWARGASACTAAIGCGGDGARRYWVDDHYSPAATGCRWQGASHGCDRRATSFDSTCKLWFVGEI